MWLVTPISYWQSPLTLLSLISCFRQYWYLPLLAPCPSPYTVACQCGRCFLYSAYHSTCECIMPYAPCSPSCLAGLATQRAAQKASTRRINKRQPKRPGVDITRTVILAKSDPTAGAHIAATPLALAHHLCQTAPPFPSGAASQGQLSFSCWYDQGWIWNEQSLLWPSWCCCHFTWRNYRWLPWFW